MSVSLSIRLDGASDGGLDVLVLPVADDADFGTMALLPPATREELGRARATREFRSKLWEVFLTSLPEWRTRRLMAIGAGVRTDWTTERFRRLAVAAGLAARQRGMSRVAFVLPAEVSSPDFAQAVTEGLVIASFDADTYKTSPRDGVALREIVVVPEGNAAGLEQGVERGRVLGVRTNDARALSNEPGNVLSPPVMAERVVAMATTAGLAVEVLEPEAMERLGMGMLLGVGRASAEPPRLVTLTYAPAGDPDGPVLGFVGKGVTFDTGGISIKPADGMDRMKTDMSGGAAVAAALCAIAELKPGVKVVGVIPMVENMPGGRAIRPGDVLRAANGKSVEVNNTDAEGRLILGDALWYAQQKGATHLVDVATLTGACVVALGKFVSGLFGNDDAWRERVRRAGARAGDRLWPMPLDTEFGELLKSDIADIVNTGGRAGGAITAAWFLKEFTGGRPWAHLDIAGTAWADDAKPYYAKGPTGVAVRTLVELALAVASGR